MPRYVIERVYTVDEADVPAVAARSKRLVVEEYPDIVWEHSHVVLDDDGTPKSFCVYDAPTETMVRAHADQLGDHIDPRDLRDRRRRHARRLPAVEAA